MLVLTRVDSRLIHGQVLEAWVPFLKVDRIAVADDVAATSPLTVSAMTLALPPEVEATVTTVDGADLVALQRGSARTLLLVRDVDSLKRLMQRGLKTSVNLGNVHAGPGREAFTRSVFLNADELESLRRLSAEGTQVQAQAVPSDAPLSV